MKVNNYIKNFINLNIPFLEILRTDSVQTKYDDHIKKLKLYNIKIEDYIKINLLCGKEYKFCLNLFPYNFEEPTLHYVFWIDPNFNNKYNLKYSIKTVECEINKIKCENGFNKYIAYENPEAAKSITGIKHFHFIFYN